ncbi:MAG TPA: NADH-quinone oxidoreductase subunit J [Gemmatimonadaceae bacterium]|jgi:NADH-quinone oxidoreductase subunit J|nr:NADH-quinone oxidoreductase subunit J [Gemmatimonadaceae bacterium]
MMHHGFFFQFNFYVFGLIAIASAIAFVTRKSPVAAALWLVNTMFCLAALYVMLDAQFIGAIQVLLYAGAIMVVFLFVVMLLNLGHVPGSGDIKRLWPRLLAGAAGILLLAELSVLGRQQLPREIIGPAAQSNVVTTVAGPLFNEYLLAFEVTSILLLAAIIGAVVLAKRRV